MSVHRQAHVLSRTLAACLALAALAAPAAGARPAFDPIGAGGGTQSAGVAHDARQPAPTVVRHIDESFDWGSAAIGAGGGAGAVLLTLAGASTLMSRRRIRPAR
jgi:hypothetical protein